MGCLGSVACARSRSQLNRNARDHRLMLHPPALSCAKAPTKRNAKLVLQTIWYEPFGGTVNLKKEIDLPSGSDFRALQNCSLSSLRAVQPPMPAKTIQISPALHYIPKHSVCRSFSLGQWDSLSGSDFRALQYSRLRFWRAVQLPMPAGTNQISPAFHYTPKHSESSS